MGDAFEENFDLPTLLKFGDLDIRDVAESNRNLLTKDFFALLLKFSIYVREAEDALARIADQNGTDDDLKCLSEFITLLGSIGCSGLISGVNAIIDAGKKGDRGSASSAAKKTEGDLDILKEHLLKARKKKPEPINNNQDINNAAVDGTHPLNLELKLLDYQDMTRKLRVLAVDDAPVMLKLISSALSNEYNVYGMTNPKLVEKFLQQITPELFLLDYMMPGLSGFQLIPIIRNFKEHKKTPIIFLTSQGTINNISAAVALGACDFMVKPFQPETLREKVAKHIVRKRSF